MVHGNLGADRGTSKNSGELQPPNPPLVPPLMKFDGMLCEKSNYRYRMLCEKHFKTFPLAFSLCTLHSVSNTTPRIQDPEIQQMSDKHVELVAKLKFMVPWVFA